MITFVDPLMTVYEKFLGMALKVLYIYKVR